MSIGDFVNIYFVVLDNWKWCRNTIWLYSSWFSMARCFSSLLRSSVKDKAAILQISVGISLKMTMETVILRPYIAWGLRDAFKGRTDCGEFSSWIRRIHINELDKEDNPVYLIKFVVELLCLARVEEIEKNVIKSLKNWRSWICETIESCRNLSSISV